MSGDYPSPDRFLTLFERVPFHRRLRRESRPAGPELEDFVRQCAAGMRLRRRIAVRITPAVRAPALFGKRRRQKAPFRCSQGPSLVG